MDIMKNFVYILFIITGVFSVIVSLKNWEWYFNKYKAQRLVRVFGRTGAKIIYILTGIFMVTIGIVCLTGN